MKIQNTNDYGNVEGCIFDIKKYAIHDGPGIRTTVFLKGCPLRCNWCHNPESWSALPELIYRSTRCVRCGQCVQICPEHVITLEDSTLRMDRSGCTICGQCVHICPQNALEIVGKTIRANEVLRQIEKDTIFYDQSSGGATFSGGEPLAQLKFLTALLILCKNREINTAVDTSCYTKPENLLSIIELADIFLCDLKHLDPEKHREFTGVDNHLILDNIHLLAERANQVIVRIPIIPSFNDTPNQIKSMANFIKSLKTVKQIDLLPYNSGGIAKAERLEKDKDVLKAKRPDEDLLKELSGIFEQMDFQVKTGG